MPARACGRPRCVRPGAPLTGFSLADLAATGPGRSSGARRPGARPQARRARGRSGGAARRAGRHRERGRSHSRGHARRTGHLAGHGHARVLRRAVRRSSSAPSPSSGETGAFKAFAPLPCCDPGDRPSTGYDDVRTIALARLMCRTIPSIQVDWLLYGPKLAQVAIAYGADDIDRRRRRRGRRAWAGADRRVKRSTGISERPLRSPSERNGRYETRAVTAPVRLGRSRLLERAAARATDSTGQPRPMGSRADLTVRFDLPSVCATLLADGRHRSRLDSQHCLSRPARRSCRARRGHRVGWAGGVGRDLHPAAHPRRSLAGAGHQFPDLRCADANSVCTRFWRDARPSCRTRRSWTRCSRPATRRSSSATRRCLPTIARSPLRRSIWARHGRTGLACRSYGRSGQGGPTRRTGLWSNGFRRLGTPASPRLTRLRTRTVRATLHDRRSRVAIFGSTSNTTSRTGRLKGLRAFYHEAAALGLVEREGPIEFF